MRDNVEDLRAMAKLREERKAPWEETTLLYSAAAEIERLRKVERQTDESLPHSASAEIIERLRKIERRCKRDDDDYKPSWGLL